MTEASEFRFNRDVACSDGKGGSLTRVIIDPGTLELTHLVVDHNGSRLVPIDLVASATAKRVVLRCSHSDFQKLEPADEQQAMTGVDRGQQQLGALPFSRMGGLRFGERSGPESTTTELVPLGKAQIRGGDPVYASDGAIGKIQGLLADPGDFRMSDVLLAEGHVWGKREVSIPVSSVTRVDDGVVVSLTQDQLGELPLLGSDVRTLP